MAEPWRISQSRRFTVYSYYDDQYGIYYHAYKGAKCQIQNSQSRYLNRSILCLILSVNENQEIIYFRFCLECTRVVCTWMSLVLIICLIICIFSISRVSLSLHMLTHDRNTSYGLESKATSNKRRKSRNQRNFCHSKNEDWWLHWMWMI